jgi:hypothetical protein
MPRRRARTTRTVRPTALIYCEGAEDLVFIRHLKKIYSSSSQSKTHFTVTKGSGGGQDRLVADALKFPGDFDRKMVKADKDRGELESTKAERLANRNNVLIAWSIPCLEGLLLSILDNKSYVRHQASTCKRLFERDHIPAKKRSESSAYERIFPKAVLEEARTRILELNSLIEFFTTR